MFPYHPPGPRLCKKGIKQTLGKSFTFASSVCCRSRGSSTRDWPCHPTAVGTDTSQRLSFTPMLQSRTEPTCEHIPESATPTAPPGTTPLQVLSCAAALEQDVCQEISQNCGKSPALVAAQARAATLAWCRYTGVSPGGNSSQSQPAGTDRGDTTPL